MASLISSPAAADMPIDLYTTQLKQQRAFDPDMSFETPALDMLESEIHP